MMCAQATNYVPNKRRVPIAKVRWGRILLWGMICCLCFALVSCRSRDALLTQAQTAWDQEDWATATARYEDFLRESPPSEQAAEVHFKVANVYYLNMKSYERAAEHYIRIIEDYPAYKEMELARQRLAECFAGQEKIREAISEYENLLKAFPDTPNRRKIRLEIANLYYEHDKSQALMEYQKVVKDAPYDGLSEKAYLRIGGIRIIRNEFEDAIPAYLAVIDHTQDPSIKRESRDHVADCYEKIGNYDEAVKILEQSEPDANAPDYFKRRVAGVRERQKTRKLIQPESER